MSGSILCAPPNEAHQGLGSLPPVLNGSHSQHHKDSFSRQNATCVSLPPLPRYPDPVRSDKRWGEDNLILNSGVDSSWSGNRKVIIWINSVDFDFTRLQRNNFDCCHPVPDVLSSKYEGYMYPKPTNCDVSVLHYSPNNTSRRVQRDAAKMLIPTHNLLRKTEDGQTYELEEATRRALADYITRLYRTSRYDLTYRDTADFMRHKEERDRQFLEGCRRLAEPSPYCNIKGYPVLGPYCSTNTVNQQDFKQDQPPKEITEELQKKVPELTDEQQSSEASSVCNVEPMSANGNVPESDDKNNTTLNEDSNNDDTDGQATDTNDTAKGDAFGPWKDSTESDEDPEPFLLSHVYNFKLPSSLHNSDTENEYSSAYLDRHGIHHRYSNRYSDYFGPWTLQKAKLPYMGAKHLDKREEVSVIGRIIEKQIKAQQQIMASHRNSWTFREPKHNLRIPCVSNVIGFKNKTDAHTKIHIDHQDPVPDPRDFKRDSKRVNFYGYNASVFR